MRHYTEVRIRHTIVTIRFLQENQSLAVIGIVSDFVPPNSIIEPADVREFVHLVVLVVNRLNRSV